MLSSSSPSWPFAVFAAAIVLVNVHFVNSCPNSKSIYPCKCVDEKNSPNSASFVVVNCNYVQRIKDLSRVTENIKNYPIDRLVIFNSDIGYLPHDVFDGVTVKEIQIRNTPLGNFSLDDQSAFAGVENSLRKLLLRRCFLNSEMPIDLIGLLTKLTYLNLADNRLTIIKDSWFNLPHSKLQQLFLNQNKIRFIQENSFSKLNNLIQLDLSENRIRYLQRSMFPKPFRYLKYLYLSYNQIAAFPNDMFTEMSSLERLYLDNNQITVLNADSWIPVWNTIKRLDLIGNNVTCDCSFRWTTERAAPPDFYGQCGSPNSLEGRKLSTLTRWDISEAPEMIDQFHCRN